MMACVRQSGAYRWTMRLAAFVVLAQALIPFYHAGGEALLGRALADAGGRFCAAMAAAQDDDYGDPVSRVPPCPVCFNLQVLSDGFILPSEPVHLATTAAAAVKLGSHGGVSAASLCRRTGIEPRAPPSAV
jgi:hypothetical protein